MNWFRTLPSHISHVITYSDTRASQNRSQFITSLVIYVVQTFPNIHIIDMKFMESGHSYLEVDSMHATIEQRRRHWLVYAPGEMRAVIEGARQKKDPYTVLVFNDEKIKLKMASILDKNIGLKTMSTVSLIDMGKITTFNSLKNVGPRQFAAFKFAPIVACSVERSFSTYKRIRR